MDITTLCLGEMETNCYIVSTEKNNAVLIDPAYDAEKILNTLSEKGLKLAKILLTHGHFDHIMAVSDVLDKFRVPVYVHVNDKLKLTSTTENLHAYFFIKEPFREIKKAVTFNDGDEIRQDELIFKVLHTPGHTRGSVCFICGNVIFTGDTIFEGSIGRTDMRDGNYETIVQSLKKINRLDGDYILYPGHGNKTTLNNERRGNVFLSGIDII